MRVFAAVLAFGLALRLVVLATSSELGLVIFDERHFTQLASSLLHGNGFAWGPGDPTSLRPPAYPLMIAGIWSVTSEGNLQAIRAVQILLAMLTTLAVYELGRRVFDRTTGVVAASVVWLYPSLIYLNFTILTETLFTFLLTLFLLLAVMLVQRPGMTIAASCGLALGLGALTRSVLWPLPLLLCPLLLAILPGSLRRRVLLSTVVFAGYAIVVMPWAVRNTRLQQVVTVVDTIGGMNLRMGNYEYTPEDRMWDAVALTGEKNWVHALTQEGHAAGANITEGQKEKWAQRKAVEYMLANPGITARRAVIKFWDFWGLERSFVAGLQQGIYHPPRWFGVMASAAIIVTCVAVMIAGAIGLWVARPDWRVHILMLLPIVVITGVHTIVFGHARYHKPLVPIVAIYAAAWMVQWQRRNLPRPSRAAMVGAALSVVILLAGWGRQALVVEGDRLRSLMATLW